jgi:hypothetical protein
MDFIKTDTMVWVGCIWLGLGIIGGNMANTLTSLSVTSENKVSKCMTH